jgi:hypothetical protein
VWCASNPTFHRTAGYGIVLTNAAVYTRSQLLWPFARWRRMPLDEVREARFEDSRWFPRLRLLGLRGARLLRTPYDHYADEMEFDRRTLAEAARRINDAVAVRGRGGA